MKVVVFGDSISKGIISNEGRIKTVKYNVVDLIAKHYDVQIKNISQYGQTLKRLYEKKIVQKFLEEHTLTSSDSIVFSIGGNDADYDWKTVAEHPRFPHNPKTPLNDFVRMYTELLQMCKKTQANVYVMTIFPIHSQTFYENVIGGLTKKEDVLIFLRDDVEAISRHQEGYNLAILKCAYENSCTVIDIRSRILFEADYKKYICYDGIHPNEQGYKYLSNLLIEEIDALEGQLFQKKHVG